MTESLLGIIMPAFPRASKEVRVRELSVMVESKTDYDPESQINSLDWGVQTVP
ncbi:MAG: hypothetical protein QOF36_1869 [Microbacteriaceae bacterium]|jgi:hypothetical protein|nr:hypothetical protein [Microbacteriaceae bacterium]